MKRNVLFCVAVMSVSLVLSSCYSYLYVSEGQVQKIELGMTKEKIISLLGTKYETVHLSYDEEGNRIETLGYRSQDGGIYKFYMEKGKLVRVDKDWLLRGDNCGKESSTTNSTPTTDNSALKFHLDTHRNIMLSGASSDFEKNAINFHMDAHSRAVLGE